MERIFAGKKLLILGATPNEIPLVKRAQELGAYVITTDYNLDYDKSPAKKISDECWDISWSDLEELERKCKENKVDGITAGFSEIRVDNLIRLCKQLNLPCYINDEQLAITRDKILFKNECRKYGVPVIREYQNIDDVKEYPVIVKPTDRAGSIGVGIAYNREELERAYSVAMEKSLVKSVIIEDYITDAIEMDAHYAICDGEITLLTTDDIIPAMGNKDDGKVVQSAWMYPSRYDRAFKCCEDTKLKAMIKGMGVNNGTIFFSGFVNEKEEFSFFECGFRLWGEQEFNYDYLLGNVNYLDIYIYHALTGRTEKIEKNMGGSPKLRGVALNLYVKGGTISKIEGVQELEKEKDCCLCIVDSYIGQECSFDNAILTKAALVGFANTDSKILKEDIENAYKSISICDVANKDMLYDYVDAKRVETWWDER